MSKRFGKYRVADCSCDYRTTCAACLDAAVARNIADRNAVPTPPRIPTYRRQWPQSVLTATVNRCIEQGAPVIVEQPARKEFCVASISDRANAFGLHGCILVALDGEAWEVGHCQCSPPESAWRQGQIVSFATELNPSGDSRTPIFSGCEIPRRLPNCPAGAVQEIFTNAFRA